MSEQECWCPGITDTLPGILLSPSSVVDARHSGLAFRRPQSYKGVMNLDAKGMLGLELQMQDGLPKGGT